MGHSLCCLCQRNQKPGATQQEPTHSQLTRMCGARPRLKSCPPESLSRLPGAEAPGYCQSSLRDSRTTTRSHLFQRPLDARQAPRTGESWKDRDSDRSRSLTLILTRFRLAQPLSARQTVVSRVTSWAPSDMQVDASSAHFRSQTEQQVGCRVLTRE